jgi:NAD+ diphosphatase
VLVGADQEVALTGAGRLALVPLSTFRPDACLTLLGLEPSGEAVFAVDALELGGAAAPRVGVPPESSFVPLRSVGAELAPDQAALAAYAVGMVGWHRVHRHCGRCGNATAVEHSGHRRRCPVCGLMQFPRTDPAVTMLVRADDRCLLSRRRGAPENRWSALAGFVEPGESLEEAVVREAREETGVEVVAVEYVASQPWPFPAALMIGFWAFADPAVVLGALEPDLEELVEVRWFERAEVRDAHAAGQIALPPPGTIGNYLISTWLTARSA